MGSIIACEINDFNRILLENRFFVIATTNVNNEIQYKCPHDLQYYNKETYKHK